MGVDAYHGAPIRKDRIPTQWSTAEANLKKRGRVWVVVQPVFGSTSGDPQPPFHHLSVFIDLNGDSVYQGGETGVPTIFKGVQEHLVLSSDKKETGWTTTARFSHNAHDNFDTWLGGVRLYPVLNSDGSYAHIDPLGASSPCDWMERLHDFLSTEVLQALAKSNPPILANAEALQNSFLEAKKGNPKAFKGVDVQLRVDSHYLWSSKLNCHTFAKGVIEALSLQWPQELASLDMEDPAHSFVASLFWDRLVDQVDVDI